MRTLVAQVRDNSTVEDDLLSAVLDHAVKHGAGRLAFRPLAEALGVSTFKLVYHFGSKKQLVQTVIEVAVTRQVDEVRRWLAETPNPTVGSIMKRYWDWASQPHSLAVSRLFFEANGLGLYDAESYPPVFEHIVKESIALEASVVRRAGFASEDVEPVATVVCAVVWGLQLDLLSTGDSQRTTDALHLHADLIDGRQAMSTKRNAEQRGEP